MLLETKASDDTVATLDRCREPSLVGSKGASQLTLCSVHRIAVLSLGATLRLFGHLLALLTRLTLETLTLFTRFALRLGYLTRYLILDGLVELLRLSLLLLEFLLE